jgi:hypothetical protein
MNNLNYLYINELCKNIFFINSKTLYLYILIFLTEYGILIVEKDSENNAHLETDSLPIKANRAKVRGRKAKEPKAACGHGSQLPKNRIFSIFRPIASFSCGSFYLGLKNEE